MKANATAIPKLTQVATQIDDDLLTRLDAKCEAEERKRANGIRQAIRAWVEDQSGDRQSPNGERAVA